MRILGLRASAVLLLLCAAIGRGQTESQKLADQARALPPEYAADILFRLLATGRISDAPARREMLEELYGLAGHMQSPVAMVDAVGWTDTRSWATGRASALRLDTLSIQCRVVKDMLGIDPARARQMLAGITLPPIDHPRCEAALVPDVSIYYETGAGDLEGPIRSLTSALQLPAAAKALRVFGGTDEARRLLLDVYAGRLGEIADSDRAAETALGTLQLPQELVQLAESARAEGISVDGLLAAYRKFLARHASGERCADSAVLKTAIDSFNDRLRWGSYLATQDLPRLGEDETKASSIGARAKADRYWRTEQAKQMLSAVRHLRFGDGSKALPAQLRASDEWQAEAKAVLDRLEQWKADQEPSAADSFHERAILYGSLLQLIPPGALSTTVAQSAISYLSESAMKTTAPAEWLLELKTLLDLKQVATALTAAKDPVIVLYGTITYQK